MNRIRVLQELSLPGALRNEDAVAHGAGFAALLDGATSLVRTEHDAVWFTRCFLALYRTAMEAGLDIPAAVNSVIARMREDYPELRDLGKAEYYSSAAGILVRLNGEKLELFAIGDCTALLQYRDGRWERIHKDDVDRFDDQVLDQMRQIHRTEGLSLPETMALPAVREHLLKNRSLMNQPGGYRILSFNMAPVTQGEILRFPVGELKRVVLFSDGFDSMQERFYADGIDLQDLYQQLRSFELRDSALEAFPRFKLHDDASAILFDVVSAEGG